MFSDEGNPSSSKSAFTPIFDFWGSKEKKSNHLNHCTVIYPNTLEGTFQLHFDSVESHTAHALQKFLYDSNVSRKH